MLLVRFSFLHLSYLLLIFFLSPSCINFVLISGKVLVYYRKKCSLALLKSPFIDIECRFSVFERRFNVFERTFNVFERTFNVFERTFNVGERTFNVGERRFYLGIKSNASTVSILFNGKSRPNPSRNHSPERNEDTVFPVDGLDCFSPFYGIYNLLSHFLRS